jgi:SH3 domain-containing YSC84-like protein 1
VSEQEYFMHAHITRRCCAAALAALWLIVAPRLAWAGGADDAKRIVDKARIAFDEVAQVQDFSSLRSGLKTAKGVLIFPSIIKGGFVVGGSGGTGVLLVRGDDSAWSEPAFYTIGAISVGLLIGGQATETVILVNSQTGVDRLLTTSVKLGGDASIAVGPVGEGKAANLMADFVSYAKSKGAYVGASVDGSVLDVRDTLNHAYYGKAVTPTDILVKRDVSNKQSQALKAAVAARSR